MTFLTPTLAAIAAAIAIPSLIILYFLKLRRRDIEVSSTLLWKQAIQDMQANAPFQRLRRNLLLFIQLIVLGLVLFALAQPERKVDAATGNRLVLVIDRSASSAATDGDATADNPNPDTGRTRLDQAKDLAIAQVELMKEPNPVFSGFSAGEASADQAMVIVFDTSATVVQQFTGDKARLRAAIESIQQTDAPSSLQQAFELVKAQKKKRVLVDNQGGQAAPGSETQIEIEDQLVGPPLDIKLFTDGRVPDAPTVLPAQDDQVAVIALGSPDAQNVAIVDARAERGYEDPNQLSVFVGIQSNAPTAARIGVELFVDGLPRPIEYVDLPAATDPQPGRAFRTPSRSGIVLRLNRPEAAVLEVRLDTAGFLDRLAADNRAFLVVPPARAASVAVVGPTNSFIALALRDMYEEGGLPLARFDTFTPEGFEQARSQGKTDGYDVVFLDGWLPGTSTDTSTPPTAAASATPAPTAAVPPLPPGRWVVFNAVPPPLIPAGPIEPRGFVDYERSHPVLRDLTLEAVRLGSGLAAQVPPQSPVEVLAQSTAGPIMFEVAGAGSRALVVPVDVRRSTWGFDVSFVVFLSAAIDYLRVDSGIGTTAVGSFRPGDVISDRLPEGATGVTFRDPLGVEAPVQIGVDGQIAFGPVRRVGVYAVEWTGQAGPLDLELDNGRARRRFAVNLTDAAESDIAAAEQIELATGVVQASAQRTETRRSYWPWLIIAALGLVMLEWFIYNKRVYV